MSRNPGLHGRRGLNRQERGSVAVETAIILPLLLLLTLGGVTVLWWLHNKGWMHLLVSETARERAADATWTGYYKDIRDTWAGPAEDYGLPDVRLLSFHLPVDPPMVVAAACNAPGGLVPEPPPLGKGNEPPRQGEGGWLEPVGDVRRELEELVGSIRELEDGLEGYVDQGVVAAERLIWYRRAAENLVGQRAFQRRQALDYLVGGLLEEGMRLPCRKDAGGGSVLTAKAVIWGERTYGQR